MLRSGVRPCSTRHGWCIFQIVQCGERCVYSSFISHPTSWINLITLRPGPVPVSNLINAWMHLSLPCGSIFVIVGWLWVQGRWSWYWIRSCWRGMKWRWLRWRVVESGEFSGREVEMVAPVACRYSFTEGFIFPGFEHWFRQLITSSTRSGMLIYMWVVVNCLLLGAQLLDMEVRILRDVALHACYLTRGHSE